jgi:hypothetical protein
MKGKIKRRIVFVTVIFAVFAVLTGTAYAEINRGEVLISGEAGISVAVGGTATITVDPYRDGQTQGCQMPECPTVCGEADCIMIIDGGNARSNNRNCTCLGVDNIGANSSLDTFETSVSVSSGDAAVASASYDGNGNITVRGLAPGATTVSVSATLREWTAAQRTVAVTVTEAPAAVTPSGNSGSSYSGSSGTTPAPAAEETKADATASAAAAAKSPTKPGIGYKAPPAEVTAYFDDVSGNAWKEAHWASESVYYLAERGIVAGKSEHLFAPDDPVTRAEFVKLLTGVADADVSDLPAPEFADVAQSAWYASFVAWASENGVVTGSGGSFAPGANITRQDMAVMIYRFLKNVMKSDLPAVNESTFFDDDDLIGDYAKEAVLALRQAGVLSGTGANTFSPRANATRAEAAAMLTGLMHAMEGE